MLVSEIMSHQTPVARVEPVWREWMSRWPTPADLAAESPGEVVRAWGRLGYPRRALRLLECARAVVDRYDGVVPDDVDALMSLPGVGHYTARAVAVFAFGQRHPVVDVNVRRVVARSVEGLAEPGLPSTRRDLEAVSALLPEQDADEGVPVGSARGLEGVLDAAGLSDIEVVEMAVTIAHPTFEEWWEPFQHGVGPIGQTIAALDPGVRGSLEEALRARLGQGPFERTGTAFAGRGRA